MSNSDRLKKYYHYRFEFLLIDILASISADAKPVFGRRRRRWKIKIKKPKIINKVVNKVKKVGKKIGGAIKKVTKKAKYAVKKIGKT